MGYVYRGIPEDLVIAIIKKFNITSFIESGTNEGKTAVWAAQWFKNVFTIELSKQIFSSNKDKLESYDNIHPFLGNSPDVIRKILSNVEPPRLIWLDAHYNGNVELTNDEEECPLLREIEALNGSDQNWIFIDDARYFISPPPKPHDYLKWPDISEIMDKLKEIQESKQILIWNDIIISPPTEYHFNELRKAFANTYSVLYANDIPNRLLKFIRKNINKYKVIKI